MKAGRKCLKTDPEDITRIVVRVSRLIPGALCLAQAIASQRFLARFGVRTVMRIGVKTDSDDKLSAHAWLLLQEKVILGGRLTELREYRQLTDIHVVAS